MEKVYGIIVQNNPINFNDPSGLFFKFKISKNTLVWVDFETGYEDPAKTWEAVSGPYGQGSLPAGFYHLTGEEMPATVERNSMTDTCKNAYKYRLHPQFHTTRSGLLVHPDGGKPGTEGCIGVTGCTTSLRTFLKSITPAGLPNHWIPLYVEP